MKFGAIENANFGTLTIAAPLDFSPGLNVIIAANQAGKTTLFKLLEWTLYGVPPRGKNRNLTEVEAWSPWSGARPSCVMLIVPEQPGLPSLLRVEVQFDRFVLAARDAQSLDDLTGSIELRSNGTWSLGRQLTGLGREAYLASLMAEQGSMERLLNDSELRKLLTADLAGLVEDPERANLDIAIRMLDQPKFKMQGLADTEVLLRSLQKRAGDAFSEARSERVALEERFRELEQALSEREEAESRQAEAHSELEQLGRQIEEYNLATAHWRYRRIDQLRREAEYWNERMASEPSLRNFPRDLRQTVERWQGESAALTRELESDRGRFAQESRHLLESEEFLRNREGLGRYVPALKEVEHHRSLVLDARERLRLAEERVAEHAGASEPEARQQFEELDSYIRPHRAYLPRILSNIEERSTLEGRTKELAARRDELSRMARGTRSKTFYFGVTLLLLGLVVLALNFVFQLQAFDVMSSVAGAMLAGYALGGILTITGLIMALVGSGKRRVGLRAESDLAREVRPQLTELLSEESELKRQQMQLQRSNNITDETWNTLAIRIPKYMSLKLKHEGYSEALTEREHALQQMTENWRRIRSYFLDLPKELDLDWLSMRIGEVEEFRDRQASKSNLNIRVMELEREITLKEQRVSEMQQNLARLLEPLGLYEQAISDPQTALARMEQMAQQASQFEEIETQLRRAEELAQGLRLNRSEFARRFSELSEERRIAIESLVTSEETFSEIILSIHDMDNRRAKLEYNTARASADVSRLRETLARDEAVLAALPEAQKREKLAQERQKAVDSWQRASELLSNCMREIQQNLSSNLAPRINEEFTAVLVHAPVMNVEDAVLGPQLDLRLRVTGAPPGLSHDDLLARLSTGARRQLALALRVAVARALGGSTRPPILLDEPLSDLDDARAMDCLRYLARLSENNQIVISTCHQAQYRWLLEQSNVSANMLELPKGQLQLSC